MATSTIKQQNANYPVKSVLFTLTGGNNFTIATEKAFIVSVKNSSDTENNGCAIYAANLDGNLRINYIYGKNLINVTYSNGSLTITNRAPIYMTYMAFYI